MMGRFVAVGAALVGAATVVLGTLVVASSSAVTAPQIELVDQTLTPFDVQDPAIARLGPRVLTAVQNAANAAAADGVIMTVTSGWRSPVFQQTLLDNAVQTYGSVAAAREYVQTPAASRHVTGEAVDIGGAGADQWLIANGPRFGLCQIYANELWHFELVADPMGNCPPLLPNAAG